jgi:hypothetical protein
MTKSRIVIVFLGCILTLAACERRDLTEDKPSDESSGSSEASKADESSSGEAPNEQDSVDEDSAQEKPGDGEASDDEQNDEDDEEDQQAEAVQPSASPVITWKSCTDGAKRAYLCEFEAGGGAAICASETFVELRLARPDGSQSVHRHVGGEQKSVERCVYASPQRTDSSLTFHEQGQRLMFETHYVNPDSDYAQGADGSTRATITVAPTDGGVQKWRCTRLSEEATGGPENSTAVATRANRGETCERLRPPEIAVVRGSTHQDRERGGAKCGADPAPEAFIDKAAQSGAKELGFSADNKTGDREKRATHTVASYSTSGGEFSEPIASCATFFERTRAETEPETLGAPPFQVDVDFWRLRYDGHVFVDGAHDVCRDFCADESARAGDFIASSLEGLSHIGPIFSYKRSTSEAGGGGPPYHGDDWGTVDLRTMQPAALDALVEPESVLKALRNDSVIRRNEVLAEALSKADSLDAALSALNKEIGATGAYSFHYYNESKNVVAMRIAFRETTAGLSPNRMSQIGIWVTPREEWVAAFESARDAPEGGFYMTTSELDF